MNVLLWIVLGALAGFLAGLLNLYSLLIAVGGACLLLLIFRLLRRFF